MKRLFKMYVLNSWLIVIIGVIFALAVNIFIESSSEVVLSKSVFLIYDLEGENDVAIGAKKTTYFDAYKALLLGNTLKKSEEFTDEEKEKIRDISVLVESSCYSLSVTFDDSSKEEEYNEALQKYLRLSEKWMKDKFDDSRIRVEIVKETSEIMQNENTGMKIIFGFLVGVILTMMGLFIWFVVDKKVRTEEDVTYYTGLECLTIVKRR